jgi:hypothetical protein
MRISPPLRVLRSHTQQLNAPVTHVFPLLCPVREADWIEGWEPSLVITNSGVAEPDCVFVTRDGDADATWVITRHSPGEGALEMVKLVPGVAVTRIAIGLRPLDAGACAADISYQLTALSTAGTTRVAAFSEGYFSEFMARWERRLNHYLDTGEMLREDGGAGRVVHDNRVG